MDIETIKEKAKEGLVGFCRVCRYCDGRACAGEVPGMGGIGTGSSFIANVEALKNVRLNMSAIHDVKSPDSKLTLFSHTLSMPVLVAPLTWGRTDNDGTQGPACQP